VRLKSGTPASSSEIEKMKVEINGSKLAYNVSIEELTRTIFRAFIGLEQTRHSFAEMTKIFKEWSALWKHYYKRDDSKTQMLHAIEEFASEDEQFLRMVPKLVHFLYDDADFLPETVVLMWYSNLPEKSPLIGSLKKLIEWIEQSDSEEDTEDEEEECFLWWW